MINRLCIIGVGLIGGSLARGLRQHKLCKTIVGTGRQKSSLEKARQLGVIDEYTTDPVEAVKHADVIVLATPLGAMAPLFLQLKHVIQPDTIITDVGSAKSSVVKAATQAFGSIPDNFVPGHPIAGTENSGVEASFAELFENRRVILTPLASTSPAAVSLVRKMWEAVGATVVEMSVEHHDAVLAATSHLPHVLAFTLVDALAGLDEKQEIFQYAAGGFRDFTRIASSDPVMWRDICLDNSAAILESIELFQRQLEQLKSAIRDQDGERIQTLFVNAKQARDRFLDQYDS